MKTPSRFLAGAILALGLGVPLALGVRLTRSPVAEHEHADGPDSKAVEALSASSGVARIALIRSLLRDPTSKKRLAAAEALDGESGTEGATLAALALRDNDSTVRMQAVHALLQNRSPAASPLLRAVLRDEDDWVRQAAVSGLALRNKVALEKLGPWVVPDLIARLDDADPKTRLQAVPALQKLTGKPWKVSGKATEREQEAALKPWKTWWVSEEAKRRATPSVAAIRPERSEPSPTVTIRTTDGKEISPGASGKVTLINFWGTWCEPCRQELPGLRKLHAEFGSKGLEVIGVALGETGGAPSLRAWCAKNGLTYPQSLAEDAVTEAFGDVQEVPVSVLVDARGRIRYRWEGEREFDTFRSAVERLMAEK